MQLLCVLCSFVFTRQHSKAVQKFALKHSSSFFSSSFLSTFGDCFHWVYVVIIPLFIINEQNIQFQRASRSQLTGLDDYTNMKELPIRQWMSVTARS